MSRRLRVALDVRGLQQAMRDSPGDHRYGGPGRYAHALLGELLVQDRHEYCVLLERGPMPPLLERLLSSGEGVVRLEVEGGRVARRVRRTRCGAPEQLVEFLTPHSYELHRIERSGLIGRRLGSAELDVFGVAMPAS